MQAQKNRKVQPKKGKKMIQDNNNEEEMINGGGNRQSCSSYGSEDDSQELNQEINNSNSKTRASRGSATDPQSLYARVSLINKHKLDQQFLSLSLMEIDHHLLDF